MDSGGPKESCISCWLGSPQGKGQFLGHVHPIIKYRQSLRGAVQKRLAWSTCGVYGDLGGLKEPRVGWRPDPAWDGRILEVVLTFVLTLALLPGHIACTEPRPLATVVVWSVCVSACWTQPWPHENGKTNRHRLGCGLGWAKGTLYLVGGLDPQREGACPDLPTVDILNIFHERAAAMRPPATSTVATCLS